MNVVITGRHVNVSDKQSRHIEDKVEKLGRFFNGLHDARVTIEQEGGDRRVELTVAGSNGISFAGQGEATSLNHAVSLAEARVEAQVRMHKEKLNNKRPRTPLQATA